MHSVIGLKHAELSEKIIGVFFDVYNELGHGFLESVYEEAMGMALIETGISVQQQVPIKVWFRGRRIGDFKADMLADGKVLLELKAARGVDVAYEKQLLNYLRATDVEVGLLLNFGVKPEFRRFAFVNQRKEIRVDPRKSAANEGWA
ncbi:MAG: GxxExxY protein [Terriglobales bacterium]|jgi:GxxExxY protein